jgi:hypothetical protein
MIAVGGLSCCVARDGMLLCKQTNCIGIWYTYVVLEQLQQPAVSQPRRI